jgi:transposase
MARISSPFTIKEDTRIELESWCRSQTIQKRYADRAKVILMSETEKSMDEICAHVGMSRGAVNKWRQRFRQTGIDGLKDNPRSGKPSVISAEDKARVIELATTAPGEGYTNWSQQRIAEKTGMSQSRVHQILKAADLKPHKIEYWCGRSTDPEFEDKMTAIVGLYMNPPENALVLCVDEKTQIQALDRTQPEPPLQRSRPKRQTATYKRHGTVSLIAALAVHSGHITANPIDRNTNVNFLKFLKKLDRQYRNKTLHIIIDKFSAHKHVDVQKWLKSKKRKIKIYFTPTYSSWLNQIEIWFNILSKDVLKGGIWRSKQQLIDQLMEYIETYNQKRAHPFEWTYSGQPLKE